MGRLEEHRDLALKILVGHSLPVCPWSLDEDMRLVEQERILWASLTDEERALEQEALMALWISRKAQRRVKVNPAWGTWTEGLGEVQIPNAAFGIPSNDFRPHGKGAPPSDDPNAKWFYEHGYRVADINNGLYTLIVPPIPRLLPETDRLLGLIARKNPGRIKPWGWNDGIQMRGTYDPVNGLAVIEVRGL